MVDRDLLVLLALLWSPPDAATFPSRDEAHERAKELLSSLGHPIPPDVEQEMHQEMHKVALRAAAADYLPGRGPDDDWIEAPPAEIAHPLSASRGESGRPRPAGRLTLISSGDLEALLELHGPAELMGRSDRRRHLAYWLWRCLPELVRDEIEATARRAGRPAGGWTQTSPPAHPRYPDSVWAVGALRAAVAAAGAQPALLHVALASVQEYVGQARRTQDLWMGSFLYAYFTWHAMQPIVERLGPWAILAPELRGQPLVDLWLRRQGVRPPAPRAGQDAIPLDVASLPNVFTALVPYEEAKDLAGEAVASLEKARNRLAEAVEDHVRAAARLANVSPDFSRWEEQIEAFLVPDLFWAVAPWSGPGDDRQRLEALAGRLDEQQTRDKRDKKKLPWLLWWECVEKVGQQSTHPGAGFPLAGRLMTGLLGARKSRRDFPQWEPRKEPGRPLCTLCAVRTALGPEEQPDRPDFWQQQRDFWNALRTGPTGQTGEQADDGRVKLQGRLRAGERLCAVCLVKRLAMDAYFDDHPRQGEALARRTAADEADLAFNRHRFPSTATVATLPFRRELCALANEPAAAEDVGAANQRARLKRALDEWVERLDQAAPHRKRIPATLPGQLGSQCQGALEDLDGVWFYSTVYATRKAAEEELSESLTDAEAEGLPSAGRALGALIGQLGRELGVAPPARYYAILALDGDRVGQWLSGARNPTFQELLQPSSLSLPNADLQRPPGPLSQAALSAAEGAFSLSVAPSLVRRHDASLVYAGGDDVLALVPRAKALALARDLEQAFRQETTERGELLMGPAATLSAAIVVAHHFEPLAEVVREAQKRLKESAKEWCGRNALAIHLLKRSGAPLTAGLRWRIEDQNTSEIACAEHLATVVEAFAKGTLSRGLVSDVRRAGVALGGDQGLGATRDERTERLVKAELLRLAKRHLPGDDADEARRQAARKTREAIGRLFDAAVRMRDDKEFGRDPKQPAPDGRAAAERATEPEKARRGQPNAWDQVVAFLRVAEFLAREDEE